MATRSLRSNSTAPDLFHPAPPVAPEIEEVEHEPETMADTTEWKTDPLHGNFNPGTKLGHQIFLEKTKGLPESDRLELSKENAGAIHQFFRSRHSRLGEIITKIPIERAADGTVTKTANLLNQYQQLSLELLQREGHALYNTAIPAGDPIPEGPFKARELKPATVDNDKKAFYKQVDSSVISKLLENCLTESGFNDLLLQDDKFSYIDENTGQVKYHGPTMLFLAYQVIDPNTVVGLDNILKRLETAKLSNFGNNVSTMLTSMQQDYITLKQNKAAPENYRRLLLDALKSGPNHTYNTFIQRIADDVESGIGAYASITPDQLIVASKAKFNNMDSRNEWGAVDPRDAKIMALTTKLQSVEEKYEKFTQTALATAVARNNNNSSNNGTPAGNGNSSGFDRTFFQGTRVEKWRGTRDGPEKVGPDGKTLSWCKHHVHPDGLWNGLYVNHKEDQHDRVVGRFKQNAGAGGDSSNSNANANQQSGNNNKELQLQSKLKEVLCTNLCMSAADAEKLIGQASEN